MVGPSNAEEEVSFGTYESAQASAGRGRSDDYEDRPSRLSGETLVQSRHFSGVLAIVGAAAVVLGGYLPYSESSGFKYRIFETKAPHAVLFYAAEPAAVAIAAAVLGIMLLVRSPLRLSSGVLLGTGVQTSLMYLGYVGSTAQSSFGGHVKAGGWVGMLGGALIAAAGSILLAAQPASTSDVTFTTAEMATSPASSAGAAAGWYGDPGDGAKLRYWTGSGWTEHTHPAAPPAPMAATPAAPTPAPPYQTTVSPAVEQGSQP